MSLSPATAIQATPDELVSRVFDAMVQSLELYCLYIGDRLGFYQALQEGGPATAPQLAARAGTNERATREWLERQATAGILACANPDAVAAERRYSLPGGYAAVLVDRDSLRFVPPMAQITAGAMAPPSRSCWRRFAPIGDVLERMMYGFSVLHCLPVGLVGQSSAGTGTVMRRPTFRRYAADAGFAAVAELPIANDFFRFYRLTA